ncbi:MAG: DoxX family protein [Deltaproteobacteria bacterium]|nr:MAG: DoxX family protein [Deltaproteobacteria bacterium]
MTTTTATRPSNALHIGLWAAQGLLALAFLAAGSMKLTTPNAELIEAGMLWVERFPSFMRYVIGSSEVLGAVGLVLPAATGIQPKLTPLAAAGLTTVMLLATADHAMAGEFGALPVNFVLGSLAAFVAWGRYTAAPIEER